MPVASADPFGGVIITDWYTPPGTSGERFKATIYILSRDLRSDGVRVNIYRQVLQNGPVDRRPRRGLDRRRYREQGSGARPPHAGAVAGQQLTASVPAARPANPSPLQRDHPPERPAGEQVDMKMGHLLAGMFPHVG